MIALLAVCLFHLGSQISAHREHKVHNIVLYPEKHSWCKTTPIKQVVGHPGCEQIEVDNNVCVGACFSYSIPRTEPTAPGEVAPYCDSCQPSRVTWKHVTLTCTEGEQQSMTKRVQVIEDCSCLTCRQVEPNESGPETTSVDVPQLLNMLSQPKLNATHPSNHIKHQSSLLRKLNIEGTEQFEALVDEMRQQGVEDGDLKGLLGQGDEKEQVKLDVTKLKQLLEKIETKRPVETQSYDPDQGVHRHQHGHHHPKVNIIEADDDEKDELLPTPTLDVASHHLRPAVEGAEITYLPEQHHHHHHQNQKED